MISVVDEVLSGEAKYRIKDENGNILYDNVTIEEGTPVNTQGTPLNKVLFDSIQADINSRVLKTDKATQAQAEGGSDNTKYMTSLRTKNYCDKNVGIKITKINLSSSDANSIDLSTYLTSNVEKLVIILNCKFAASNMAPIALGGTGLRLTRGGKYNNTSGGNPRNLGGISQVENANIKIEIFPNINSYNVFGNIGSNSQQDNFVNEVGGFDTLTTLTTGKRDTDSRNYDYQVAIYKYLK